MNTLVLLVAVMVVAVSGQGANEAKPTPEKLILSAVPQFSVPDQPTEPFSFRGWVPLNELRVDFEILWDGRSYRGACIDAEDGLPIMLSDKDRLLVFDPVKGEILCVEHGRFHVGLWQNPKNKTGFLVSHFWDTGPVENLRPCSVDLRTPSLAAAGASVLTKLADGSDLLVQRSRPGGFRSLRFVNALEGTRTMEILAGNDAGGPPTFGAYYTTGAKQTVDPRFPDLEKLAQVIPYSSPDQAKLVAEGRFQFSGLIPALRSAIRGDPARRQAFDEMLGKQDWDELTRRDNNLKVQWLAALKAQEIQVTPPPRLDETAVRAAQQAARGIRVSLLQE